MTLDSPWEVEQAWGSHQPVLKAVLEVLNPHSVIECGSGNYSTPHLQKAVPNLLTIEHDPVWAKRMMDQHPAPNGHQWIVNPFNCHNGTAREDLPPGELERIQEFYKTLGASLEPCDFLFMDTYRAARIPAVQELAHLASVILLHDLEPPSPEFYHWHLVDEVLKEFHHYLFAPEGLFGGHHKIPWTALYSREPLSLENFHSATHMDSMRLWNLEAELKEVIDD